jgi:hypothetical protein
VSAGQRIEDEQAELLMGVTEIAERAYVSANTVVINWRKRYETFPAPVLVRRMGPLFWWPDVEAWLVATGRLVHSAVHTEDDG